MCRCSDEDMENYGIHLLALSHAYSVPKLKQSCVSGLSKLATIENVVDVLHLARLCDAPDLYLNCAMLIRKNFRAVKKTEGWKFLHTNDPWLEKDIVQFINEDKSVIMTIIFFCLHWTGLLLLIVYLNFVNRRRREWRNRGRNMRWLCNWVKQWNVWNIYVRKDVPAWHRTMWMLKSRGRGCLVRNSPRVRVCKGWFDILPRVGRGSREGVWGVSDCGNFLDFIHVFAFVKIHAKFLYAGKSNYILLWLCLAKLSFELSVSFIKILGFVKIHSVTMYFN